MKYYEINEQIAKVAQDINSFREYTPGSATSGYKAAVDEVYMIADEIQQKKPEHAERAYYMADRYAKKYADYLNAYYRNEASCPSVLICGAGNFPTRKKNKQNSRRDSLMNEYNYLVEYKNKIKNILLHNQPIKAGDADAIERLTDKIQDLNADKELMKELNKHFRSGGTLESWEGDELPQYMKAHIYFQQKYNFKVAFDTSNINAEIKRLQARLDKLTELKETGTTETTETDESGNELFQVVRNTELMRLQLIFDGKPADEIRDILKHNGFKWSPRNEAWQRQLTDNAEYSLKRVIEAIKNIA